MIEEWLLDFLQTQKMSSVNVQNIRGAKPDTHPTHVGRPSSGDKAAKPCS
jgi:hypothetical protein